jgi:DNA polymerase III gamma/tau subunit
MAKDIIADTRFKPMNGTKKIFILNEVHKATPEWQNAMLEILEEPPSYIHFILCTTDPDRLLKTIRSRCTTFQVSSLQRQKIIRLVKKVCESEGVSFGDNLFSKIAEYSDGSPRTALVMLDQVIDMDEETAIETLIKTGGNEATLSELCQAFLQGSKWEKVSKLLREMDIDEPEKLRYGVLGYLSKILLNKPSDRISSILELFSDSWMYSGKAGLINTCYLVTKVK